MSLEEFARELEERFRLALGEGAGVQLHEFLRNNGTKKLALTLLPQDRTAAPVIYLEGYYARFRLGEDMETLMREILRFDRDCRDVPEEAGKLAKWEEVRNRLGFRLINREMNRRLLETMPHRRFLDLAVTYLVFLGNMDGAERTIAVNEAYRSVLGVTEEQLYLQAMKNQPRLQKGTVKPMAEMLRELTEAAGGQGAAVFGFPPLSDADELPMAVITNRRRYLGAGAVFYPGLLEEAAALLDADRIFLIPASIHEMIAVSAEAGLNPSGLCAALREINETGVSPEERLSDSLYMYDCGEERLRIMPPEADRNNTE